MGCGRGGVQLARPEAAVHGLSRRDLLRIGGLGAFGLGLADWNRLRAEPSKAEASPAFGKTKSCILVLLFGFPPRHETFDPRLLAPVEVQGEMKAISTADPGVEIGEGLPLTAGVMDRMTNVRSMNHPYALHGVAYALTGMPTDMPEIVRARPHSQDR